jgi:hypothetical protein
MASTAEIEAAAESIKVTIKNMYGVERLDLDDRYQVARNALRAAEAVRRSTDND